MAYSTPLPPSAGITYINTVTEHRRKVRVVIPDPVYTYRVRWVDPDSGNLLKETECNRIEWQHWAQAAEEEDPNETEREEGRP